MLEHVFPGESDLAGRMRALDWAKTDLGDPERWPQHLKAAVSICLTSRFPVVMYWGPNLTVLYNDAYVSFLGPGKHPRFLGHPGRECWAEVWDTVGPMLESVRYSRKGTFSEDMRMYFARVLPQEEVYVRFAFGPILSPDGRRVDGIFCPCTETTEQVVGKRRLETLRRLGMRPSEARDIPATCKAIAEVLADNPDDIPFAAIYLVDELHKQAGLVACAGLPDDLDPLPRSVAAAVQRSMQTEEVPDLGALGWPLPGGPYPEPTRRALVLPIVATARDRLAGLLLVGVSPRRVVDAAYRTFFELVAAHVGTAIGDAQEAERRMATLSHELRGPLAPIANMLEVMRRAAGDAEVVRQAQDLMERQLGQLVKLVDDMLEAPVDRQVERRRDDRRTIPRRILVVDDNPDSVTSLSMLLKLTGNETQTAHDGLEAVSAAERFRPDVVLMDLGMPGLNGADAARRIREQAWGKDMVLVAITGWGQDEVRRRAKDAGFDAHMVKPVDHEALMELLATTR